MNAPPLSRDPGRGGFLGGLLVLGLFASGAGDILGGAWAVADWKGVSALMAGAIHDWHDVGRAASRGLEDAALRQLWANLGTALLALGTVQWVAAWWVRRGHPGGWTLARLVGWALIGASVCMAGPGGQVSSLLTEGARGVALLTLAVLAEKQAGRPEGRPV